MTPLEQKEFNIGARLYLYASGSGALSFVFSDSKGQATGEPVTEEDAKEYVRSRRPHLSHWIIGTVDSHFGPVLFNPVVRLDEKTLILESTRYEYRKGQDDFGFTLFTFDEGQKVIVHNISTKASIRFFLENEKRCTELIENKGKVQDV